MNVEWKLTNVISWGQNSICKRFQYKKKKKIETNDLPVEIILCIMIYDFHLIFNVNSNVVFFLFIYLHRAT